MFVTLNHHPILTQPKDHEIKLLTLFSHIFPTKYVVIPQKFRQDSPLALTFPHLPLPTPSI